MPEKQMIDYLIQRVEKIDEKVDRLLQFKWQIIGGSVAMSALLAGAIQLIALLMKK